MTARISAGLVMCRRRNNQLEFFLVHPGGPFFKNKDLGVWSIPKGLPEGNEDYLTAAQREFNEETGLKPAGPFHPLGSIKQKGGKTVYAWTCLGDWDEAHGIHGNTFTIEWPPKSGRLKEFPEQDKAAWMTLEEAENHIIAEQLPLLQRAIEYYTSHNF